MQWLNPKYKREFVEMAYLELSYESSKVAWMPRKRNVVLVAGTRPEMIKLWPVVRQLQKTSWIQITLINTGQQRELSLQAARSLRLKAVVNLNVMRKNQ